VRWRWKQVTVAATDVLFFRHDADTSVQFVAAEQRAAPLATATALESG
jgi:hypothetical protein